MTKVTLENLECTQMWKDMRDPEGHEYYLQYYYQWLIREKDFNSEELLEAIYSPHRYRDEYYLPWLRKYLIDYYEIEDIARA